MTKQHVTKILLLVLLVVFSIPQFAFAGGKRIQKLTLKQAQQMAIEKNPNIKSIGETIYQADILINKAWAILLPNLSMDASVTRAKEEIAMEMPPMDQLGSMLQNPASLQNMQMEKIVMQDLWSYKFGATANMTLFNARSIPLLKNAYDNQDFSKLSGRHQTNELIHAVTAMYYQVDSAEKAVSVAKENYETATEFNKLTMAKIGVGQATKIDKLRSENELMKTEKDLKNAEDSLKLSQAGLAYMIGIKDHVEIETPDDIVPVKGNQRELTDLALGNRLDLKSAKLQRKMADRNKTETWTKWVPKFDVTFNWSWNSSQGYASDNDTWMLIFGVKWNILEGGMKIAELYERESIKRQARNSVYQQELQIREEVEKNLVELNKQERNIELAENQVALVEETHRLIQKQYEVGMATSLDVSEASTQLSQVRFNRVLHQLQYNIAALNLNKAVGRYNKSIN